MKMGLRMANLLEPWKDFEEKYTRIKTTSERLYQVSLDKETV